MSGVDRDQTGLGRSPSPTLSDTLVVWVRAEETGAVMLNEGHEGETYIVDWDGSVTIPEDEWQ